MKSTVFDFFARHSADAALSQTPRAGGLRVGRCDRAQGISVAGQGLWPVAGGRRRQAVRGYELTRIEAVQVDGELQTSFLRQAKQLNENRANGPEAMFSPRTADPDGEKAAVLRQLKEELLPLDGLPRCGVVLGLHGTSHANADNLFRGGFAQINFDDNGAHAAIALCPLPTCCMLLVLSRRGSTE